MIRRDGTRIIITCDGCGEVRKDQSAKWRPYPAAWQEAQAAGWTAKKKTTVSDYDHFCPACNRE